MKITTRSEQPQMRSALLPHTSATLTVSKARNASEQEQRDLELEFMSLLIRALNPQIRISRVNEALRLIVEPNAQQKELWAGAAPAGARAESTVAGRSK